MKEEQPDEKEPELTYELKSVKEAAQLLRVSESTVWRYADQDLLPSYRVGRKRVMFRRGDLESLLNRLRRKREPMKANDNMRMYAIGTGAGRTEEAVTRARALQAEILARRGGASLAPSWEAINEAREERTDEL